MDEEKVIKVNPFGGAEDGSLFNDTDLPIPTGADEGDLPGTTMERGQDLWAYRYEGKIDGIRVAEGDRDLLIPTDKLLHQAFELHRSPFSWMRWMSPDIPGAVEEYNELLKRQGAGEILIMDERMQYDPEKKAYLAWVRYAELEYRLNKRYDCIRNEDYEPAQ